MGIETKTPVPAKEDDVRRLAEKIGNIISLAEFCGRIEGELAIFNVFRYYRAMKTQILDYPGNHLYGGEHHRLVELGYLIEDGDVIVPSRELITELDAFFQWKEQGRTYQWQGILLRDPKRKEEDRQISGIIDYMMSEDIRGRRNSLKLTILHRPEGVWHNSEVDKLVHGLFTELQQHPKHPEYLILFGHFTKEQTLEAIGGGIAYTAIQVTGIDSDKLPFRPQGWVS